MTQPAIPATADAIACPFHGERTLPRDGMPLTPSPTLSEWRDEAAATPLTYNDGHDGLIITRHELARMVLGDSRFSQRPQRMPGDAGMRRNTGETAEPDLDQRATDSMEVANLLSLDGAQHAKVRRTILGRFTVKSARGYTEDVAAIVARALADLKAQGSPADIWTDFAQPISAAVHCRVLGVPDSLAQDFATLFVGESTSQQKVDFLRQVLAYRRENLADDVLSDLIRSDLTDHEVEGLTLVLFTSGRDSVAYMIATGTVALLHHPDQLAELRENPELISGAIEEFMRYGAMFITLFPRTATEDLDFEDVHIRTGQSVSVSPVAANRDERQFEHPAQFDIHRDAFGHLGFGYGVHGCVGQQVARLEIREAITQMLGGLPGLRLVHAQQLEPMPFAHPVATYEAGEVIVAWE